MSKTAVDDMQWLQSLPQNLDFERFFWSQPDEAKAWMGFDDTISVNDNQLDTSALSPSRE